MALSVWQANLEWRMLEYRALGGLCVVDDGDDVNLGGPRQRRLAAALLIDRNRVVSVDRLGEVVFAGEPTPGAATTLRSYVARLRRVVEGAGSGSRVVTRKPGYMLEVGDAAFDVARFEASVATGRACLTHADPADASRALREGLGLWRGAAYAEFADEDWVRPEAQRLAELRLVAYDLLADAELACGRAAEAASDLEVLAAEHPLRESFQAKLMLALYRSGRHVEALRAYQAHREVLADELGLEPAPELAELEGRILAHDEAIRELEPGELRLRGYRLGERLGSGRDGTMYAARLPGVDRDIAIRVVPEALANDPGFVRSFDADARRVAALRHPAVVPLYDWWREAGAAYVVMRRMRGGTLRDRVQRGAMPAGEVAALAGRVGAALVAAVEAGIAHGRVVAESVLFDEAGNAHLADFPLGTDGAVGDDVRDLAAVVAESLSGPRPPGATVDGLAPPVAEVVTAALSAPEPPALVDFVPAVVAALSGEVAEPVYERPNPYKGLRAFDEPDAEDFFGRDALVDEVLGRLAGHRGDGRLVLVVGGSGSGKSSLVRAGLLPRVRRGEAGGSDRWFVASMVPGASPFKELAESLRQVAVIEAPGVAQELAGSEEGIDRVLRRIVPEGGELLLVVDQLEELFTLAGDGEQRAFLDGLIHALGVADSRLRVVATLRADFYDRPLRFEGFGAAVGDATVPIAAMSAAELEAAIVGPLERVGGRVERALVAELVGAVLHEPAALPSMQFTLYELAERSPDRDLTLAAYRQLGGVDAAIAARAEALYRSLDDAARGGVRRVFERLVVVGTEGEPTRRRALRAELTDAAGPATDEVLAVIEAWAQARLLTLDRHLESRQPTVEVAHEALLRDWPRLRGWLEEDREEIVALGQLREAAAGWDDLGRDPGALYRGARLDTALDVAERGARTLPPLEQEFLDASRTERDRERQREADQLRRTARANRRLRAQLVALAIALVVALVVGAVAVGQRNRASEERRVATARELAAAANANLDVDPERSILLAVEAVDVARRADGVVLREAEEALHRAVQSSRIIRTVPQGGFGLAVSSDGARFVTGGLDPDATATVWDTDTGEELVVLQGEARALALSPDDRLVAIAHGDGTVRLWDAATGDVLHVLGGHEGFVTQPAFSPDGRWLAAGGQDWTVRVWDVASGRGETTLTGHTGVVISTAFSPDGARLATASDDTTARIWDLATGEVAATLTGHAWGVTSVAFSPDGRRVATASIDGEARIWDAETGTLLRRFAGPASFQAVVFSPDGSRLATAGSDAVARVWDVETGRELVRLAGHSGVIGNLAFTPDGDRLLTTGVDGTTRLWDVSVAGARDWLTVPSVRGIYVGVAFAPDGATFAAPAEPNGVTIWDAATGDEVITLAGHEPKLTTVAYSPDGGKLVGASDLTARPPVWDVRSGELLFTLDGHTSTVRVAAFSPDGRRIVTGSLDTTARVWDAATGEQLGVLRSDEGAVDAVAYSPDGRLLVTGDEGGNVRVWDATTLEPVRTLRGHTSAMLDVSFGPGGMLVTASDDGTARVWDVASGAERVTFRGHRASVNQVAISRDGTRVATTSDDATTQLWDPTSGRELLTLVGHNNTVWGVDFSPDGRLLATASTDGTTALHLLPIDEFRDLARERVTRGLTDQECRDYLHLAACP